MTPPDALEDLARSRSAARHSRGRCGSICTGRAEQVPQRVHLKIVKLGEPVPISDLLPMLENFGLRVISERPYELAWPEGGGAWIQDFELEHRERLHIDIARIEAAFTEAFAAAWRGDVENDGFNRLLLAAGLNAREIVVLRAYCRYLLQTGVPFSQAYMERTLAANAGIAQEPGAPVRDALRPGRAQAARQRSQGGQAHRDQIRTALDAVTSLDEDRILRAYLTLIQATLRTNFYQRGCRRTAEELRLLQARPAEDPGPAAAAAEIRDLRVQPACRRRAPAHGLRRPRRHALVGPARRLPHRSAGPDEGAEREEHA